MPKENSPTEVSKIEYAIEVTMTPHYHGTSIRGD
jgi:hypothetical protein